MTGSQNRERLSDTYPVRFSDHPPPPLTRRITVSHLLNRYSNTITDTDPNTLSVLRKNLGKGSSSSFLRFVFGGVSRENTGQRKEGERGDTYPRGNGPLWVPTRIDRGYPSLSSVFPHKTLWVDSLSKCGSGTPEGRERGSPCSVLVVSEESQVTLYPPTIPKPCYGSLSSTHLSTQILCTCIWVVSRGVYPYLVFRDRGPIFGIRSQPKAN